MRRGGEVVEGVPVLYLALLLYKVRGFYLYGNVMFGISFEGGRVWAIVILGCRSIGSAGSACWNVGVFTALSVSISSVWSLINKSLVPPSRWEILLSYNSYFLPCETCLKLLVCTFWGERRPQRNTEADMTCCSLQQWRRSDTQHKETQSFVVKSCHSKLKENFTD